VIKTKEDFESLPSWAQRLFLSRKSKSDIDFSEEP